MTFRFFLSSIFLLALTAMYPQQDSQSDMLRLILRKYYQNEKVVVKGRSQLLYFYCEKGNNNEEIFEVINQLKLPAATLAQLKQSVLSDTAAANWNAELDAIGPNDSSKILQKVNGCVSLEAYQSLQSRNNLNHQRLMIVSKPIFYNNSKRALVKVVFYRTIEHNSGSVLHLEQKNGVWTLIEQLNSWST